MRGDGAKNGQHPAGPARAGQAGRGSRMPALRCAPAAAASVSGLRSLHAALHHGKRARPAAQHPPTCSASRPAATGSNMSTSSALNSAMSSGLLRAVGCGAAACLAGLPPPPFRCLPPPPRLPPPPAHTTSRRAFAGVEHCAADLLLIGGRKGPEVVRSRQFRSCRSSEGRLAGHGSIGSLVESKTVGRVEDEPIWQCIMRLL